MTETIIDPYDDDNCCTCMICGGHRAAYSDPPVCKEPNCKFEYDVNIEFNQWAKGMI